LVEALSHMEAYGDLFTSGPEVDYFTLETTICQCWHIIVPA